MYSDILEFLVILFTLLAVLSAVVYVYTSTRDVCVDESDDDTTLAGGSGSGENSMSLFLSNFCFPVITLFDTFYTL